MNNNNVDTLLSASNHAEHHGTHTQSANTAANKGTAADMEAAHTLAMIANISNDGKPDTTVKSSAVSDNNKPLSCQSNTEPVDKFQTNSGIISHNLSTIACCEIVFSLVSLASIVRFSAVSQDSLFLVITKLT